jgi:DNA primase catalytic core
MTISEVKNSLNILDVARHLGVEVLKGEKASCPFHTDKNPSFQFSSAKQIGTCFSSNCNAGTMDVISFAEKKLNLTTHETINYLKQNCMNSSILIETVATPIVKITEVARKESLKKVYNYFRNGYHLRKDNLGRNYMQSRNIEVEALENAGINLGYNSAQFHHRERFSLEEKYNFCKIGLLKENSSSKTGIGFTPWASHCVIFPLKNKTGEVVSFYGRSTKWDSHFYLTNRQGLFPKYPTSNTRKLILTESIIDACSLLQSLQITQEFTVLALYGTNGFTEEHNEALNQLTDLEEVILFLDGDEAGNIAVENLSLQLNQEHPDLTIAKVNTPTSEDVNSLLEGHTAEVYEQLLSARTFLFKREKTTSILRLDTQNPNNILYNGKYAHYEIKGGIKRNALDSLKITLLTINPETNQKFRDKLDLYEHKQLKRYSKDAGEVICLDSELIETDVHTLIDELDNYRENLENRSNQNKIQKNVLTPQETAEAVAFGKQKDLLAAINDCIGKSGVVGEEDNRLFLFVVAVSHLMKNPLNVIVQGSSGSGKSHLIKKISHLVPQERVKRYTRLSEKVLFNFGEYDLVNTLIIVEDYDGIGEEAEYAFRELISNRVLISGVSSKDEKNGEMGQSDKTVRGPIASMLATTKGEIYHDNSTRVFFISVDETEKQTSKIVAFKNQISAGEVNPNTQKEQEQKLQNFVNSLSPYTVKNPFLKHINLPVSHHQLRRLHELFTSFCEQITLINQHQRTVKNNEVTTEKEDVKMAIDLLFESIVLKVDELDGSLRLFYEGLKAYAEEKGKQDYAFTQREIRMKFLISQSTVYRYMESLLTLEYIEKTYTGKSNTHHYKIVFWDDNKALKQRIKKDLNEQLSKL